ncbi:MAG: hypothetical protein GY786_08740, partial [Proteobacteria bacterium]|nr:hypothetical protein [Pseudomonadota bacterium]
MYLQKYLLIFLLIIYSFISTAWSAVDPNKALHPSIAILDEDGVNVLDSGGAYSSRKSCSGGNGCHDYESITQAYHFEMGRDEADDEFGQKRGLPHLISPGYYGGYGCMGGDSPRHFAKKSNKSSSFIDFADFGSPGFVKTCDGCHPGGGPFEKDRNGIRYDSDKSGVTIPEFDGDYYNRGTDENNEDTTNDQVTLWDWKKSGVVEADCMVCHVDTTNMISGDATFDALMPTATGSAYFSIADSL